LLNQLEIGFIDQRSGFERVAGSLATQAPTRDPAQSVVDEWDQLVARRFVAPTPGNQQLCHVFRFRH
jgi:hypothetical protein